MNATQAPDNNMDVSVSATDVHGLYTRAQRAFSTANQWQGFWLRILQLVAPEGNNYYTASGTTKKANVYDNAGTYYANLYISQFIANIFPPQSRWASLEPSHAMIHAYMRMHELDPGDDGLFASAKETLQLGCSKLTKQVFDLLIDSNFDNVLPQVILGYMISCGAWHVARDHYRGHGLSFFCPSLGSYSFDVDGYGNIYGVFYQTMMSLQNLSLQWEVKNIPTTLNNKSIVTVTECTVKETSGKHQGKWKYIVLLSPSMDNRNKSGATEITEPRYFDICPWTLLRAPTARSEVWGRGKLAQAYQDLERNNYNTYMRIISQELITNPFFLVKDDGSINSKTFKLGPGALVKVKSTGGPNGASLVPITMPYNLEANANARDETMSNVQRATIGDPMQYAEHNTYQSATEWSDRQRRNQLIWGSDYGKILPAAKNILLGVCELGLESGDIEWPYELEVFKHVGRLDKLGIKLESPISKMYNSQEVESFIAIVQVIQQIDPQLVGATVFTERAARWLAKKLGVDESMFKTEEDMSQEAEAARTLSESTSPANTVMPLRTGGM